MLIAWWQVRMSRDTFLKGRLHFVHVYVSICVKKVCLLDVHVATQVRVCHHQDSMCCKAALLVHSSQCRPCMTPKNKSTRVVKHTLMDMVLHTYMYKY